MQVNKVHFKFSTILVCVFIFGANVWADSIHFSENQSCVAWKTRKTMFLVKQVEPVGMNCEIIQKIESAEGKYSLIVEIPIAKFDSGEPSRDKEVLNILGAKQNPNLKYKSAALDAEVLARMKSEPVAIDGFLEVDGRPYPVQFMVKATALGTDTIFEGQSIGKFSDFKIGRIKVALGLIASVDDYLELHFHLLSSKIDGFSALP